MQRTASVNDLALLFLWKEAKSQLQFNTQLCQVCVHTSQIMVNIIIVINKDDHQIEAKYPTV